MNTNFRKKCLSILVVIVALSGCETTKEATIMSQKSAVELRSMQGRMFDTGDNKKVYRAVIACLQDLGYTIQKVEPSVGTVTADKLSMLQLTATVNKKGNDRVVVRSNAVVKFGPQIKQGHQVDSPEFYQQRFFEPLSKALFLTALQVED